MIRGNSHDRSFIFSCWFLQILFSVSVFCLKHQFHINIIFHMLSCHRQFIAWWRSLVHRSVSHGTRTTPPSLNCFHVTDYWFFLLINKLEMNVMFCTWLSDRHWTPHRHWLDVRWVVGAEEPGGESGNVVSVHPAAERRRQLQGRKQTVRIWIWRWMMISYWLNILILSQITTRSLPVSTDYFSHDSILDPVSMTTTLWLQGAAEGEMSSQASEREDPPHVYTVTDRLYKVIDRVRRFVLSVIKLWNQT